MVKRSKGAMSRRTKRTVGSKKVTAAKSVKFFKIGSKVVFTPKANCRGEPLRYAGRHGQIIGTQGKNGYLVLIRDGKKAKKLVLTPVHLNEIGISSEVRERKSRNLDEINGSS